MLHGARLIQFYVHSHQAILDELSEFKALNSLKRVCNKFFFQVLYKVIL